MKKRLLGVLMVLLVALSLVACSKDKAKEIGEEKVEDVSVEGQTPAEGEHTHGAYEWIGEFEFKAGTYLLHFGESSDATMDIGFIKMGDNIADLGHHAAHLMDIKDKEVIKQDTSFKAEPDFAYTIEMNPDHGHVHFEILEDGRYALVTEHLPMESTMQVFGADDIEILPEVEHEGE